MQELNEFVGTWSTLSKLLLGLADLIGLAAVVLTAQSKIGQGKIGQGKLVPARIPARRNRR